MLGSTNDFKVSTINCDRASVVCVEPLVDERQRLGG